MTTHLVMVSVVVRPTKKKKKAHSAYLSLLFFNWMADVSSKKKSDSRLINKYDYLKFFRNYFT